MFEKCHAVVNPIPFYKVGDYDRYLQRESKYGPECTHIQYPTHLDQQCIDAKEQCGFEIYVPITLKVCLFISTSPIPMNQKGILLMLQVSMSTTLTVQSIVFPTCIIDLIIFVNLHKTLEN